MYRRLTHLSLIILAVLAMTFVVAGCGGSELTSYTETDASKTIDAAVEEEFEIVLEGNESTGFLWVMGEGTDEKIVEKVSDEYIEPNTGAAGAGGKHYWTFKAKGAGETTIKLEYKRPWEPTASPEKTLNYKVNVVE